MSYEKDIHIDESALDVEWLDQPKLMVQYGIQLAVARRDLDLAKENLNLIKAELDKAIRTEPDKFGIEKITEVAVQSTILTQKQYKEANDRMIDSTYNVNVLQVVIQAIDHRKAALENLVRLYGQQYFAGPKIPRDLSEVRQVQQQQANKVVGTLIRRK